jgi:hypothetical protein
MYALRVILNFSVKYDGVCGYVDMIFAHFIIIDHL